MFDDLGRITIPREVRKALYENPDVAGKSMQIIGFEDGTIMLKPCVTDEKLENMAQYILDHAHFCPIPVTLKCTCGFKGEGCKECLMQHADLLNRPATED